MFESDAGRCLPLLLDVALKSLVVSATALAALPLLRRASASTRHLVLLAGLGVLLGLPALMPLLPRQTLSRSPRAERPAFESATPRLRGQKSNNQAEEPHADGIAPAKAGAGTIKAQGFSPGEKAAPLTAAPVASLPPLPQPPAETPAPASSSPMRPAWLVLGWLLGVLTCAGRMLAAQARVWRLTRRCPPLPLSLLPEAEAGAFVTRKAGPAGTPPMVWGWPRPVLLLPPDAADWPAARLRAVLRHESAHVYRRDWLTQTLAQATCALYWFNPLVWLLAARLGAEAERACDDAVLLSGTPPADYAQALLAIARHLGAGREQRQVSVGAVTMVRRSLVRGRLESILDARRPRRRLTRRAALLALAAALALAAPLASLRPTARADAPAVTAPPAGVPTEADIAQARQHLHDLEKARAAYAAAHPNTLSLTQIGYLDGLRGQAEFRHTWEHLVAREKDPHARAKLLSVVREHNAWATQIERNYRAQVKRKVDALPAAQVVREARMHGFDEAVALDRTRVEMMQMEHSLGYSLHIRPDALVIMAHSALYWEKTDRMSRADSIRISLLQQKAGQKRRIDDADIDSLIVILRKPSTDPSINRSYVMQLFSMLPQSSPAQQQKMREAITPLLKSRSHWERDEVEQTLRKLGGSAPTPPPVQKAQAAPAARPQPALQAHYTGVSAMTPLRSMKAALLKTAAFTTLTVGLTSPAAHAQPANPTPVAHTAADAPYWNRLVLQHAAIGTIMALTRWGRGGVEPEGVKRLVFMMGSNTLLVNATPDGFTQVQGIVRRLDVAPRRVQVQVTAVTVTAADLKASGVRFDRAALDGVGTAGQPPQGFLEAGTGEAIAAYRAALTRQGAIGQSPVVAADGYTEAAVDFSGVSSELGITRIILGVMPRVNGDNSVTLQLRPTFSRLITGRTNPDGTPSIETKEVRTSRTLSSGATLLLVSPLPKATGASSRYLLLFVTPTTLPDQKSASAPHSGLPRV